MIEFQPVGVQHKALFDECLAWENTESSTDSFGNVFLWDILCRRNVARLGDRLGVEYMCPKGTFYAYPSGRGDLASAIETLERRAAEQELSQIDERLGKPSFISHLFHMAAPSCAAAALSA